ncbi:MAG: toll/interleukin-1 receptor domain-containing protein [Lacibacter sp.]
MDTVFISYGGPDEAFASLLNTNLNKAGIKTFFFPIDAKPGVKLHRIMRDGINSYDKVIFICSKNSLNRNGVINELEESLQREAREGGISILIPITLDDYVFTEWEPKLSGLKQTLQDRVIANFQGSLTDDIILQNSLKKLIRSLGSSSPLSYISLVSNVFIEDIYGRKAKWFMERELIAHDQITELANREIVGTGKIFAISTNIGKLQPAVFEGGSQTYITKFDTPLPLNEPFKHILELEVLDSLAEEDEDFIFRVHNYYDYQEINIYFPESRKVKKAKAFHRIRSTSYELDNLVIEKNNTHLKLLTRNPIVGTAYQIKWTW